MPMHPALKPMFEGLRQIGVAAAQAERSPAAARAAIHTMMDAQFAGARSPHAPLAVEKDFLVPVDGGEIKLRLFANAPSVNRRPCHIHYHGGGFWLGTLDQTNGVGRSLAAALDCAVVSVDYRLAPEHKFPAAAEDSYAALLYVAEHAAEMEFDAKRISVGGASAGGNLAAAVALMARDRGGPPLVLQMLEIPVLDLTDLTPLTFADEDTVITGDSKKQYRGFYLNDVAEAANPYASPLLAADLSRLPPALIFSAEYDQLQREAAAYAARLAEAGVPVTYRCWEGQFHGSQGMAEQIPEAFAAYQDGIRAALRRAYA